MLVGHLIKPLVKVGQLTVIDAYGKRHEYRGALPGPKATIRLCDPALHWKLAVSPRLLVGEAYMDGTLTVEEGTLLDFLMIVALSEREGASHWVLKAADRIAYLFRRFAQFNHLVRARRNVAHHYDLSDELYARFLDRDRQYSCAYFPTPDIDIDTAQLLKKRHIAAKLLLERGQHVLDIGCGWGGLALHLAREHDVKVTGITLSQNQLAIARERAEKAGLADRVTFRLVDYRELEGTFDRIVSVGMFEHVGVPSYPTFFKRCKELLKPDGVALLHTICRLSGPGATNAWIRKYIFPGGYSPAPSEVLPYIERSGLWTTDIEILRLHYAETLLAWRRRFMAQRDEIAKVYDERFCRMWEFYLTACEMAFRGQDHAVMQVQFSRQLETVPVTRDYMVDDERALNRPDRRAAGAVD